MTETLTFALLFIPLGALLSDMIFGTRDLGGGRVMRWLKWALAVTAVAGSVYVHRTGLDAGWYSL